MKKIKYIIEYLFALVFVSVIKLFSIKRSSDICGFLGKTIGFFIGYIVGENKKALNNLSLVFPDKSLTEKRRILKKAYENIGRFTAEYINQNKMNDKYFAENAEIEGWEEFCKDNKNGCFAISGHYGNWEVSSRFLVQQKLSLGVIYKPQTNPYLNKIYIRQRALSQIPKEQNAMKQVINMIKSHRTIGILMDQRDKTGEMYNFFGKKARTSTAIQRLSLKYNYPMIPVECFRKDDDPNKFKIIFHKPLTVIRTENLEEDTKKLTEKSLMLLENLIKTRPEQWLLWFYARWRTDF
jgi:KDO2-lipid IV(A) lauroyltransferase